MKKITLLCILTLSFYATVSAQVSNLVIFSDEGKKFYLILNGVRQNENAQTNVKVTGLMSPYYSAKILFEDQTITPIEKKMLMVQDDRGQNLEVTYRIKSDKDGKQILRFFSQMPTLVAPPADPSVVVLPYSATGYPMNNIQFTTGTPTGTVTQTTTTIQSNPNTVNVGANVGGVGVNISVNDPLMNQTMTTTTTQTTITSSSSNNGVVQQTTTTGNWMPGYSGTYGCQGYPMSESAFGSALNSINSKGFDDSKLTIAKQIIGTNCVSSDQVRRIMLTFGFEETMLDFAKFAYGRTVDIGNYYKVNDAFKFESSIDDLNSYIQGR